MRRSAAYANFPPPLTLVSLFPSVEQFARHRVKQSTGIGSPVRGRARTALPLSLVGENYLIIQVTCKITSIYETCERIGNNRNSYEQLIAETSSS